MFTTSRLILIALGAALNCSIGTIVYLLKLPVFLDSIGTILVALLLAPDRLPAFVCSWVAGWIGLAVSGLINPFLPWFAMTDIAISLVCALLVVGAAPTFRARPLRSGPFVAQVLLCGIVTGVVSAVVSVPVVVYLFNNEAEYRKYMAVTYPKLPPRSAYFVGSSTELAVYTHWGQSVREDLRDALMATTDGPARAPAAPEPPAAHAPPPHDAARPDPPFDCRAAFTADGASLRFAERSGHGRRTGPGPSPGAGAAAGRLSPRDPLAVRGRAVVRGDRPRDEPDGECGPAAVAASH